MKLAAQCTAGNKSEGMSKWIFKKVGAMRVPVCACISIIIAWKGKSDNTFAEILRIPESANSTPSRSPPYRFYCVLSLEHFWQNLAKLLFPSKHPHPHWIMM